MCDDHVHQSDTTGGSRTTFIQRPLATRPVKVFLNFLLVITCYFYFYEGFEKILIFIPSAALRTGVTYGRLQNLP